MKSIYRGRMVNRVGKQFTMQQNYNLVKGQVIYGQDRVYGPLDKISLISLINIVLGLMDRVCNLQLCKSLLGSASSQLYSNNYHKLRNIALPYL